METSAAVIVPGRRLGKLAPRYDARTLRMAKYLKPPLARPPSTLSWLRKAIQPFGMLGNDNLGDCTCAALGHMDQVWEGWTKQAAPGGMSDDAVFGRPGGLYWRTGTEDNGRDMLTVLNEVRKNGLSGDKFTAFAAFDPTNHRMTKYVTWMFGGVYLGIALPMTAQSQAVWDYVPNVNGNEPGSWGGHAVNIIGYGVKGPKIVTWGEVKQLTWAFIEHYADEAFAVISPDWLDQFGKTPKGFDLATLQADLAKVA